MFLKHIWFGGLFGAFTAASFLSAIVKLKGGKKVEGIFLLADGVMGIIFPLIIPFRLNALFFFLSFTAGGMAAILFLLPMIVFIFSNEQQ